jgi:hypothetical protein
VAEAFMAGRIYFDGADNDPATSARRSRSALIAAGNKRLPEIYPHFSPTQVHAGRAGSR